MRESSRLAWHTALNDRMQIKSESKSLRNWRTSESLPLGVNPYLKPKIGFTKWSRLLPYALCWNPSPSANDNQSVICKGAYLLLRSEFPLESPWDVFFDDTAGVSSVHCFGLCQVNLIKMCTLRGLSKWNTACSGTHSCWSRYSPSHDTRNPTKTGHGVFLRVLYPMYPS